MRTSFNSSGLVRLLADLDIGEYGDPKQTLAERLSQWMGWTDAISLSGALGGHHGSPSVNAPGGHPPSKAASPSGNASAGRAPASVKAARAARAAAAELARARSELARAITDDAALAAAASADPDPMPWRQAYQAQQRAMETRTGALRASLRAALAGQSRELARLAALDAALERALAPRERQLLSTVPGLLERHADRLRRQDATERAGADDAAAGFDRRALHAALLAELDVRLQPIEGLLEALDPQATRST